MTHLLTLHMSTEDEAPINSKTEYVSGWITIKSSDPSRREKCAIGNKRKGKSYMKF